MATETGVSDLNAAAYLVATGRILLRAEGNGPRLEFVFANITPQDLAEYYHPNTKISPRLYAHALRDLKAVLASRGDRR